jgi:hypothetical protein
MAQPTKVDALVAMRLANMRVMHPDQDSSRVCGSCGHAVGIYPSGVRVLATFPKARIICDVCYRPSSKDRGWLAPGALDEFAESRRKQ